MTTEMNTDHPYEYFTRLPGVLFRAKGFTSEVDQNEREVWTKGNYRVWYSPMTNKISFFDTARNVGELFYMKNEKCFNKILDKLGLQTEQNF